jgi:ribosomal protein S18 acetylase RimI-like enzyme
MTWIIRVAGLSDAPELPQLEFSAGQRFREIPELAWLADADDMSIDTHRRYIEKATEWVAINKAQERVGFLAAEIIHEDLHIWELAVRLDVQNRGIGRRLIDVATAFACEHRLRSLTLTTFASVPWNAPWYRRLGFEMSSGDERLATLLQVEKERGLPDRCAMRKTVDERVSPASIRISAGEAPELEAFLAERIYEFNAKVTGYLDGKSFSAACRDGRGAIWAGATGYTWGGCCYISHLWVQESERARGVGTALLKSVERYAESNACKVILLATHTFQAPGFYERMGYEVRAAIQDYPVGYASILFAKRLMKQEVP